MRWGVKRVMLKQLQPDTHKKIAWSVLIVSIISYVLIMGFQSVLRYTTFKATAFDMGNMDQVLWNTIHGRFFQFTNQDIDWYGPPNRLGIHVEPIMLLVSLLYVYHADPRILLIFQTMVLAAGAPAVFLLSRRYLPAWPFLAAILSVAYLLSPAILGINIFDFHPDSLATPFFLYAILALTYRRYAWFLVLCVFACTCKEDMPLIVAMLGILLIWKYKLPRLGLVLIVGGSIWAFIAFKVVIPHFYTGVLANNFWYRYAALGSTPAAAVVNLFFHPWIIFAQIITLDRLYYIFSLLRSTGFLALLAPEWLLPTLPDIAKNILTNNAVYYSGVYHYNAAIVPFVMLSAIHGIRRLTLLWQKWSRRAIKPEELELLVGVPAPDTEVRPYPVRWLATGVEWLLGRARILLRWVYTSLRLYQVSCMRAEQWQLYWEHFGAHMYLSTKRVSVLRLQWLLCIWIIYMIGLNYLIAMPQLNTFWADHLPGTREVQIQQLLDLIPPDASVSASNTLNPHLSERQQITVFPSICVDSTCNQIVQYIVVDLKDSTIGNQANASATLNGLTRQYRILAIKYDIELLVRRSP